MTEPRHPTYSEALAEVQRLLATPRTPPSSNPPEQLEERVFPAIGVASLRDHFGNPEALLALAVKNVRDATTQQGPFGRPALENALDCLALVRWWLLTEAWRPTPVNITHCTEVQGRRTTFTRGTSKQPGVFSLAFWRGERR